MERTVRIYGDEKGGLNVNQLINLFWVKNGRVFCLEEFLKGEKAARAWRFLQEIRPVGRDEGFLEKFNKVDVEGIWLNEFEEYFKEVEECFYVDSIDKKVAAFGEIVLVRQIGKVPIGRVRLCSKELRNFLD